MGETSDGRLVGARGRLRRDGELDRRVTFTVDGPSSSRQPSPLHAFLCRLDVLFSSSATDASSAACVCRARCIWPYDGGRPGADPARALSWPDRDAGLGSVDRKGRRSKHRQSSVSVLLSLEACMQVSRRTLSLWTESGTQGGTAELTSWLLPRLARRPSRSTTMASIAQLAQMKPVITTKVPMDVLE